jgi:hypothetical protein
MSRAIRVFLVLASLLAPSISVVMAQPDSQSRTLCNQDALLVRPVSRTPPQPPSEVIALSLDGTELKRFAIEDPDFAVFSSVPQRALIVDASGGLTFVDLDSGGMTEVTSEDEDAQWSLGTFQIELPSSSQYVAFSSSGSTGSTYDWLLDFETQQAISLSQLFTITDPNYFYLFDVSADDDWAVASGPAVYAAAFDNPGNLLVLTKFPRSYPAFHPAKPFVAIWVSDGVTAHLSTVDLEAEQGAEVDLAPDASLLSEISFINDQTMLYTVDGSVMLNTWSTSSIQAYDTGLPAVIPAGVWNGGSVILLREVDSIDRFTAEALGWHLLQRDTGSIEEIAGLRDAQPLPASSPTSWIPFAKWNDPGELSSVILYDATTGNVATVFESTEPSRMSQVLFAGDDTMIVSEALANGSHITASNLNTGVTTELMSTEDVTTVAVAPDGCSLAIGVYRVTPEIREARVDVVSLDGTKIAGFEESRLIGWLPSD